MGSFYGAYSVSGTTGTSNYNELSNKPITVLAGTQNNPINLSSLQSGQYLISGNFIRAEGDEIQNAETQILFVSTIDSVTSKKVVHYEIIEEGKIVTRTVIFEEDGSFDEDKEINSNKIEDLDQIEIIEIYGGSAIDVI